MTQPSPRLLQRNPSPLHPSVVVEPGADELRRRMATYVHDQLGMHPELIATGWPLEVHWDELGVTATLTRGELVIPARWTRSTWWLPQKRSAARQIVESLARVLSTYYGMYADADEPGRIRRGDLVLEPGVREEGGEASPYGRARYCRIGEDVALPLERAVAAGWVSEVRNREQHT